MVKLKKYKLSDIYEIGSGISSRKEQAGHGYPFASFSTIFNNYFLPDRLSDLMETSDLQREISSIKQGDVFLTRTSETSDELAMSCVALKDYPDATFSGFVKRLRPVKKDVVYPKYIGFYLRGSYFRNLINANTTMTLRASFNEHLFKFIDVYLPEYDVQKKIGDFLYTLEEKIKVNTKINDNLSQLIDIIFKHYFLIDIKNQKGDFESILDHYDAYQPETISNTSFNNNFPYSVYGGGGLIGKYSKFNHDQPQVIISCRGSCGNTYFTSPYSWITGNAMVIKPKSDVLSKEYIFSYLKNIGVDKYLSGSVQKQLTKENLKNMEIYVPKYNDCLIFTTTVREYHEKIFKIREENEKLVKIRDFLLPLLLNGQVIIR